MTELAAAQHLALYAALIVGAMLTLEWIETRRTRVRVTRRRNDRRGPR